MIYLELFLGFLKVGCFAFGGGYGAVPLIRDVVLSNGWLTDEALTNMIAVSESTPGPIMVNIATYVGSAHGGLWGALLATTAVVLPSFVIILLLAALLKSAAKNALGAAVIRGLTSCVVGIVLATGLYMVFTSCIGTTNGFSVDIRAIVIALILVAALFAWPRIFKKKASPIGLILLAAIAGSILYR